MSAKHTILVVHEDDSTRHSLQQVLLADGYHVDAKTGVALTETNELPNLAILQDSSDGLEACQRLTALPGGRHIPILIITERDDDTYLEHIFACGAADYLVMPVRPVVLRQRVRSFLKMHEVQVNLSVNQETLRESEERHRIISNTISDYAYSYIVLKDGTLKKDWSTQAFYDITGYTFQEMNADGWMQLVHPDDTALAQKRFDRLLAGEVDVTEFRIITKSGEICWLRDHGYPVFDTQQGRVVRIYGAAQDITERKHAEEMLRQQAHELATRNEELDAFAYTVAHDLKNPIASMMGFASLMQTYYDRMTEDKVREYLSLILEGGYKLREIINALLMLAGVSKMANPEITPLDMHALVEDVKRRLKPMIEETAAVIKSPEDPESWPIAAGYGPWVEEVWMNYMSNAMKYGGTPPCIELGADAPENGMVRFWVRDNGRGLTEDEQHRVFTPFTRLNQVKIEGHGLGLSVVQRIVHKLSGEIGVTSTVGKGSEFSFTLPHIEQMP